ncbi:hypothetical protein Fcan01_16468 [Folsomia candida]|uniref:SGNH hydrolase-type esterase domain-containing protein n=1 Tax=Folsomia candida TaxID=158441 RepID=A0A226DVP7_FOLCA|nr:hypothetical protein Fcan01_16468 [Folsomia candida]
MGAFGYLDTGDDASSINLGLNDQVVASMGPKNGLMPRDNNFTDRWIRLTDVNIRISKWQDQANPGTSPVRYLDLWTHFSREWGVVEPNLFLDDQLHLTREGYEKWVDVINPLFREMMGV